MPKRKITFKKIFLLFSIPLIVGILAIILILIFVNPPLIPNLISPNNQSTPEPSVTIKTLPSPSPISISSPKKTISVTPTPSATPITTTSSSSNGPSYSNEPDPCGSLTNSIYDQLVLSDSPVFYLPLESKSNICDHSNSHYFAYSNGSTIDTTTLPNGDAALVFDGATDYITVPSATGLNVPTTGIITIEAWMRPDTLQFTKQEGSGYVHWMGKGENGKHEYVSRMYSLTNSENRPNRISGYAFNASGGLGVGSYFQDSLTAGTWIHYVFVINTKNTSSSFPIVYTKIYREGSQRDQDNLNSLGIVPVANDAPFRIATRDFNSFFKGAIGKVAIYNYELSAFQVQKHYQKVVPPVAGTAQYVKNIGSTNTKTTGTTMTITLTESVDIGHTLIARVLQDFSAGGPTMTDSKGNTYTRDRTAPNSGNTIRASIFSSPITAALSAGDTITITTSSVAARAAIVDEFSGLLTSSFVDQQNGTSGSSTTPGTTISITTTQANELIVGFTGVEGPLEDAFTEDALGQFSSLPREGTDSGSDDTNVTINGGYKSVSTTSTYKYQPTLDPTRNWINFIVSYKAL